MLTTPYTSPDARYHKPYFLLSWFSAMYNISRRHSQFRSLKRLRAVVFFVALIAKFNGNKMDILQKGHNPVHFKVHPCCVYDEAA